MAHDTEDPTRTSAADAAGMAADYSARATYARGYEDGLRAAKSDADDAESYFKRAMDKYHAEKARADAAEKLVAELRDRLRIVRESFRGTHYMESGMERAIDAALASTAEVAGGWCPVAERDAAIAARDRLQCERDLLRQMTTSAERARDEAIAERDELRRNVRRNAGDVRRDLLDAIEEAADMKANPSETYADAVRRIAAARDEVGIQLAAAQAEIARMRSVVEAARDVRDEYMTDEPVMGLVMDRLIEALRALDAVPGDALGPAPVRLTVTKPGVYDVSASVSGAPVLVVVTKVGDALAPKGVE